MKGTGYTLCILYVLSSLLHNVAYCQNMSKQVMHMYIYVHNQVHRMMDWIETYRMNNQDCFLFKCWCRLQPITVIALLQVPWSFYRSSEQRERREVGLPLWTATGKLLGGHIHTYIHTYIHAYMHRCIHAYMHICIYAYIHTCIQTYRHTDIHTYMHACIHTCIHACIHTCLHTLITNIHACIHT